MAMTESERMANPFISTKPSDSSLTVALHPLVLLTASDQITRHQIRNLNGPIVGALLGQQRGRETSAEHAFPCCVIENTNGDWVLDQDWMERRIQQYKDVHKAPALDVVGWFTLCSEYGPGSELLHLQKQFLTLYNENAILLVIHPETVASSDSANANSKLPLTIYESLSDRESVKDDGSMQVDDDGYDVKFRSLPYTIETDETEMIAIDYVAKGAGSATALVEEQPPSPGAAERAEKKGKRRADLPEGGLQTNGTAESVPSLTTDDEDQIAGITTRLNSVRMLQSRLTLLSKFLRAIPNQASPDPTHLPHLRNILALLTRLSLLTPAGEASRANASADSNTLLATATQSQANDVALSSVLSLVGQDIQGMSELGRMFLALELAKATKVKVKALLDHSVAVLVTWTSMNLEEVATA